MKEQTIAQEALNRLKSIPKERFITDLFTDKNNKCCVIGHFTRLTSKNPKDYSPNNCIDNKGTLGDKLRIASRSYISEKFKGYNDISGINNYKWDIYQQETPKERSIAFLKDMIKAGY